MPKMKTKRSAAKRFKLTGSGKIKIKHAHLRHCLSAKDHKAKKKLAKPATLTGTDEKRAKKLLRLI